MRLFNCRQRDFIAVFICVAAAVLSACGSKPIDPRTAAPADALAYFETNDLGAAAAVITESPVFQELSKTKPDLSALKGVRLGAAVTGLQVSEKAVSDENAVLNLKPRFVAIVETNAWGWQAKSFAENQLGEFINNAYGGGVHVEISQRKDGTFYEWTAEDGRKAFAIVQGSVVMFGNDESAIEKCLAVRRGEAESIAGNEKIPAGSLASGYISQEGMAQIANIVGVSTAMDTGEEENVKSFVAAVLPEILRNSIKELTWTAENVDGNVTDRVMLALNQDTAATLGTIAAAGQNTSGELGDYVPGEFYSVTRYRLKDPVLAWRGLVDTARKQTDAMRGGLIAEFAGSVFEPYGIRDPEVFLGAVGGEIWTVKLDAEGESPVSIAVVRDVEKVKASIAEDVMFSRPAMAEYGAELWSSENGEVAAAFAGNVLVLGSRENVLKCLQAKQSDGFSRSGDFRAIADSNAAAASISRDAETAGKLVEIFGEKRSQDAAAMTISRTETRFSSKGIERTYVSQFGMIGWMAEQFGGEN